MKQSREVEEEAKKYEKAPSFARCMQDVMELCQEWSSTLVNPFRSF